MPEISRSAKKAVPERADKPERAHKEGAARALTTGQMARHCGVSYQTAYSWVRQGRLMGYQTPGGHWRVEVAEFQRFLRKHGMPAYPRPEREPQRRVLVADNDETVLATVGAGLTKLGYEVVLARDGFEAALKLGRFRPHAVIVDLMMPVMDGFALCTAIRAHAETREVAVLVLTGYATPENARRAQECGADVCIAKPCRFRELQRLLEALLQAAGAHGGSRADGRRECGPTY